ncbi:MAG: hypothetical protein AMXMBFR61_14050 [Fimbriimonadales bacterium]
MKISAQEEYGIRCLLQVAARPNGDGPVTVSQIAEAEGLSGPYVEKLLRVLSRAGLVEATRGAKGGYRLTRDSSEITLGDALRALGEFPGSKKLCDHYVGKFDCCVHRCDCSVRPVWAQIASYLGTILDGLSLADLVGSENTVRARLMSLHASTQSDGAAVIRRPAVAAASPVRSINDE